MSQLVTYSIVTYSIVTYSITYVKSFVHYVNHDAQPQHEFLLCSRSIGLGQNQLVMLKKIQDCAIICNAKLT